MISDKDVKKIMLQILDAVNYLHEKNIIHGDFNIENVLINPENLEIKIIDFGLSKILNNEEKEEVIMDPMGNPSYRIPNTLNSEFSPFFRDIWGVFLISMSACLRKEVNSNKMFKMMRDKEKIEDSSYFEIGKKLLEKIKTAFNVEEKQKLSSNDILNDLTNMFTNF